MAICGAGIGTSAILKVSAERALSRLGIEADVSASDVASIAADADDAQVILVTEEYVGAIVKTFADIIVIENIHDQEVLTAKIERALT